MIIPISLFFSISVKRKLGFIKFNSAFSISILFPAFLPTFTTFPAFPPLFPAFPPPFPAFPSFHSPILHSSFYREPRSCKSQKVKGAIM